MQHNLLINGKLVAGEGEVLPVFNPANGEAIIEIAEATEAQVDAVLVHGAQDGGEEDEELGVLHRGFAGVQQVVAVGIAQ